MQKLHQCLSCGHLSTAGSVFTRITAENGRKVRVCDECAESYGRDTEVTRWVNQAAERIALESVQRIEY
jgi:protein-arginine kinase activator protein McsA